MQARRCPLCNELTEAPLCAADGMATLLNTNPMSDPSRVQPGTILGGRYEVLSFLGAGGFAQVFEARHRGTGRSVAVKVLESAGTTDDRIRLDRFFREARVTAGLRHPNTVRVFDFGQDDDGLVFLAMELLEGQTLREEMDRRRADDERFTQAEATAIACEVARSLAEAHAGSLVHRDLKPDNIFLHMVEGEDGPLVKVLDFGIVKSNDATLTAESRTLGTPQYMSPEQVLGHPLDGRSDLYALGVVLYELVSGAVPHTAASPFLAAMQHVNVDAPSLLAQPGTCVSEAFAAVVHRALARDRDARFADASELRAALLAASPAPAGPRVEDRPVEENRDRVVVGAVPSLRGIGPARPATSRTRVVSPDDTVLSPDETVALPPATPDDTVALPPSGGAWRFWALVVAAMVAAAVAVARLT